MTKTIAELKKELHVALNDVAAAQPAILELVDSALEQAYLLGGIDEVTSMGKFVDAVKEGADGTK